MGATTNPHDHDHLGADGTSGGADVYPLSSGGTDRGSGDAPTAQMAAATPLVSGTMADRCVTCGAPFASDQRYCMNCGERRGKARFSAADLAAPAAATATAPAAPPPDEPRQRMTSAPTFIAGIGTLLLAMGVGVLIGHNGSSGSAKAPPVQVITASGGGGGVGTGAANTPATSSNSGSSSTPAGSRTNSSKTSGKAAKAPATVVVKKAAQAASKVLGGNANLPPPTTHIGSTGSGAGFDKHTHRFTGNFFGQ